MEGLLSRRSLLIAAMATPLLGAGPPPLGTKIVPSTDPDKTLYGAAVRAEQLTGDAKLRRAVATDCDWITPEIDFKWNALEYRRGDFWFERADALASFATASDKQLRGHTLLWDQSTPDWAKREMESEQDWRLVERWFDAVLGRYGENACEWDVVNEPIDTENGDGELRRNCFQRAFGSDYIADALRLAHAKAPGLPLMINEYSLEYTNPVERDRRHALLRLAERLQSEGAPLHGIGFQAHLDLAKGPLDAPAITAMLREIEDMGLTVSITELDVKEANRNLPIGERDQAIADEVQRYLDIVLASSAVRGVVTWGISDRDSWLQDAGEDNLNRGLPRDENFGPKPMYWALRQALTKKSAIA